ncbi:hypothetical protein AGMMS50268_05740 [Spirochaetia bacterium]|nr:hypothetical protein AGMMS50268_05740 [Spirochaetia bacterium]
MKTDKCKRWFLPVLIVASALIVLVGADKNSPAGSSTHAEVKDRDLVIPLSDLSSTAQFYPVEIDGTKMEILAVQASDGTYRTAFNTCQVCYASGRGYYKQNGNVLQCQNCGNRFRMNQVEVRSGGCNPVPIFPQNKTVDSEKIVISREFLQSAREIFARWKR